ncbi:MAG: hypothetical protein Q7T14_07665 [Aestuariivirga sp.]|nr:hypothetical protein [Aestuariivirga sp.]
MLLPFAGEASADFEVDGGEGSWIAIRGPIEDEGDALIRLGCKGSGLIDTHLGGMFGIGEGKHEAASVILSSGALTARVQGVSIWSEDFEMTGGTELLTALFSNDNAFRVLTSGREITLLGGIEKAERFELGAEATAELKAFIEKCG